MSDEDPIRFRVTVTGEYESTPGCAAYDGETDPQRMAAIDVSNGWRALLESVGSLSLQVEPIAALSSVREGGGEELLARVHKRLQEEAGLGRNYLTTLENGQANPRLVSSHALAAALGCTLSELIRDAEKIAQEANRA